MRVGRHWKLRKHVDNKGMTLVEVIIAMVIMSLVVVPTMRLFSSSASYNAKSRKYQRAVSVAESIMESFKAYSMEDLCKQFRDGNAVSGFKIVNGPGATMSVTANAGPLDANDKLVKSATDFEFKLFNADEEGQKFDIVVKARREQTKNVLDLDTLNPFTDAVIQLSETDASTAVTAISTAAATDIATVSPVGMMSGGTVNLDNVQIDDIQRTIDVKTTHNGSSGVDIVTVQVKYEYTCTYTYSYRKTDGSTGSGSKTITGTIDSVLDEHALDPKVWEVFNNSATTAGYSDANKKRLQKIFLYYFPLYEDGIGASDAKDIINIEDGGLPLKVSVAKQQSTVYTSTSVQSYEAGYDVELTGSGSATLTHNLGQSLVSSSTTVKPPSISGFADTPKVFADNTDYSSYSDSDIIDSKGVLYNLDIEVYNAGETASPVATFTGTMND